MAHREARNTRTHYRCRTCDGDGEVTVNRSGRQDPQCDEPAPCPNPACVEGWVRHKKLPVDPLDLLAHERDLLRHARVRYFYNQARAAALKPVRLPPDEAANPLFQRARAEVDEAIQMFAGFDRAFSGVFGRPLERAA